MVSVQVDKHYALVKPALQHEKSVFVEFPLATLYEDCEELVERAKKAGVKTIVGAQARANPTLKKVQKIVQSGEIGEVISTTWTGHFNVSTWFGFPQSLDHFVELDASANQLNIGLGPCKQ